MALNGKIVALKMVYLLVVNNLVQILGSATAALTGHRV